jgi:uncharacterized protein (DUF488 family)
MMFQPLYTFGYSGKQPEELHTLAEQLDALVADIRFSPRSRVPHWNGGSLVRRLGHRYRHLPALGNRNYKGARSSGIIYTYICLFLSFLVIY